MLVGPGFWIRKLSVTYYMTFCVQLLLFRQPAWCLLYGGSLRYDVTLFRQQQAVMHEAGRSDTTNMRFEAWCNIHQMHVAHESRAHRFWQRFMFDTCCISNRVADFTPCLLCMLCRVSIMTCSNTRRFNLSLKNILVSSPRRQQLIWK